MKTINISDRDYDLIVQAIDNLRSNTQDVLHGNAVNGTTGEFYDDVTYALMLAKTYFYKD